MCSKCRHKYQASEKKNNPISEMENDDCFPTPKRCRSSTLLSSPPSVSLSIPSTSRSHSNCFLCKRPGSKLIVVPASARFQVFFKCEIIIPAGSRCCPNHVDDGYFKADVWSQIKTSKNSLLNSSSILDLVQRLRAMALQNSSRIDFESSTNLSDSDY